MTKIKEIYFLIITRFKSLKTLRPKFNFPRSINIKKYLPYVIIAIFGIALIFGIIKLVQKASNSTFSKIEIKDAKATQIINKEFEFPLMDKGVELSKIKFVVESAELRDEIIVKGQRATSVSGRTFLILNLKVTNDFSQLINISTRDYIRLLKNGNTAELLAPEIHNDPVEIQAISTKYTRLGFAINESDTNLIIKIGEINGQKQDIEIKF